MNKVRIVLADDHPLIRAGFRTLLGKSETVEIIGEAADGKELIEMIQQIQPDIILMDISMPIINGLDAISQIAGKYPSVKFIILTMHEEREYILQALKAGVSGYLLKNVDRLELETAIDTINRGGKYFSPVVTTVLADAAIKPDVTDTTELTPREREVLVLVSKGNSTKQIADVLKISIRTVESHRINMLKKMKVNNTAELIKKATELKILT